MELAEMAFFGLLSLREGIYSQSQNLSFIPLTVAIQ